ncbi:MAG: hypothetical protein ABL908_20240 [Hyphomicrobium sp.]
MSKTLATAAAAVAVTMTLAAAPAFADRVDARQDRQSDRIEQGIRNGSLTRTEAARLKSEQDRIAAMERAAERDGRVTRDERARLEAAQDQASRNIRAEKHDSESRTRGWNRWGRNSGRSVFNDHSDNRRWYRRWW